MTFGAQRELPFDVCSHRHGGNAESTAAHERIQPTKAAMQTSILNLAVARGEHGITCDEVEQVLGYRHQTASARCAELKQSGRLIPTDRRRPTRSGCSARVLIAVRT